jgi:hypothetical protein
LVHELVPIAAKLGQPLSLKVLGLGDFCFVQYFEVLVPPLKLPVPNLLNFVFAVLGFLVAAVSLAFLPVFVEQPKWN